MTPRLATLALLAAAALPSTALAQANAFSIVNPAGRIIGKSTYTIAKTKDGYAVKSRFEYRTGVTVDVPKDPSGRDLTYGGAIATDAQISAEYKVDPTGNFLSGFLQNGATQTITSLTPTKPRDTVIIGGMQGGVNLGSRSLTVPKPDFLLAADYDPSAMQVLLTAAIEHPHPDHIYLLVIPGVGRSPNNILYITVADPTDATGTLDAKPLPLKHYALAWNKAKGDLYADDKGTLMLARIGTLRVDYVRNKFKLDDTAK
jgi:hypothetical protein